MKTLAWWITIREMLVKAPHYQNILDQIKRKFLEIGENEEREEEEKNRVVNLKKFLRDQAIRKISENQ